MPKKTLSIGGEKSGLNVVVSKMPELPVHQSVLPSYAGGAMLLRQ